MWTVLEVDEVNVDSIAQGKERNPMLPGWWYYGHITSVPFMISLFCSSISTDLCCFRTYIMF